MAEERLKEIATLKKELDIEERRLRGTQGICSICGNDAEYADRENRICNTCYREQRIAEAWEWGREKYGYLLGLKIKALVVEWHAGRALQAIELDNGCILKVEREWEGGTRFSVSKRLQIPWNWLKIDSLESEEGS